MTAVQPYADLRDWLQTVIGPEWAAWHYGDAVPGAALFARFVQDDAGRYVLAGVMLLGDAITADQLRKVPVAALENSQNLSRTSNDLDAAKAQLPPLRRDPGMSGEDFSRLVAQHYRVWARHVPHAAAAMGAEWNVKPPTVAGWIREARLRGLLPPARRRKAGA